jgi:hypothetical protein
VGHQGCSGSIKSGVVGQELQSRIGRSDIWGWLTPQTQLGSCIYHIDVNILLKRMIAVRTGCRSEREIVKCGNREPQDRMPTTVVLVESTNATR